MTVEDAPARRHQLHGVQPVLPVADVTAAADYFVQVLGFELDFLYGEPPMHGRVRTGDGSYGQPIYIHLTCSASDDRPEVELRIHVGDDVDGLHAEYLRRGAQIVEAPVSRPWGLREFLLRTPDGHWLRFCGEA
jgi:uncharacterized glyoxalase superfamily protein PhnB